MRERRGMIPSSYFKRGKGISWFREQKALAEGGDISYYKRIRYRSRERKQAARRWLYVAPVYFPQTCVELRTSQERKS